MGKLILLIAIAIVIIKVLRNLAQFRDNRPKTDGSKWDGNQGRTSVPPAGPQTQRPTIFPSQPRAPRVPVARTRPMPQASKPSPRVATILEQLRQQVERDVNPRTDLGPGPQPQTDLGPGPQPQTDLGPGPQPQVDLGPGPQTLPWAPAIVQPVSSNAPPPPPQTQQELVEQTMATAFPAAIKMIRETQRGLRPPILLSARGKANLRRGVLLAEVLGPARAYDV